MPRRQHLQWHALLHWLWESVTPFCDDVSRVDEAQPAPVESLRGDAYAASPLSTRSTDSPQTADLLRPAHLPNQGVAAGDADGANER